MPTVLLDQKPLSLATYPNASDRAEIETWIANLINAGVDVKVASVSEYELRRELIRSGKLESVKRLDEFIEAFGYVECSRSIWQSAAQTWADARNSYAKGSKDEKLDADKILCGHALEHCDKCIVATENLKHFTPHVCAKPWRDITPASFDEL